MSVMARTPGPLRERRSCQRLPHLIAVDVSGFAQPFEQPKRVQHGRIDADAHPRVTVFPRAAGWNGK